MREGTEASLSAWLRRRGRCVVAFSGGVDSTYLAAVASEVLGEDAVAITVDTPYIQRREIQDAGRVARLIGVRHRVLTLPLAQELARNPADRCYCCKALLFRAIAAGCAAQGEGAIVDGTNADDREADRPGMRALRELGVASPLRDLGFTKDRIRGLSRERGLPTWDKPPWTCLLTRLPYGDAIEPDRLARVERAEEELVALGLRLVRVRDHGELARIETAAAERAMFCDLGFMDRVAASLRALGYRRVALDLEGYRGGGMAG